MNSTEAEQRTCAILAVDVVGYSRLMAADERGTYERLVRLRTSEFGVRLALGATGARVQTGVLRQGAALVVTGIALALPLALVIERLLAARLYRVDAFDALTLGAVAVLLGAIALIACWLPARRAARVNPIEALRYE